LTEVAIYLVIYYVEKTSLMTYPTDRVCELVAIPLVVTKPWRQVNHRYVGRWIHRSSIERMMRKFFTWFPFWLV